MCQLSVGRKTKNAGWAKIKSFIVSSFSVFIIPLVIVRYFVLCRCLSTITHNGIQLGDGGRLEHLPSSLLQSLTIYESPSFNETVRCIQGDVMHCSFLFFRQLVQKSILSMSPNHSLLFLSYIFHTHFYCQEGLGSESILFPRPTTLKTLFVHVRSLL